MAPSIKSIYRAMYIKGFMWVAMEVLEDIKSKKYYDHWFYIIHRDADTTYYSFTGTKI